MTTPKAKILSNEEIIALRKKVGGCGKPLDFRPSTLFCGDPTMLDFDGRVPICPDCRTRDEEEEERDIKGLRILSAWIPDNPSETIGPPPPSYAAMSTCERAMWIIATLAEKVTELSTRAATAEARVVEVEGVSHEMLNSLDIIGSIKGDAVAARKRDEWRGIVNDFDRPATDAPKETP